MFCFKCGEQLRENSIFCHKCGAKVNADNNNEARENSNVVKNVNSELNEDYKSKVNNPQVFLGPFHKYGELMNISGRSPRKDYVWVSLMSSIPYVGILFFLIFGIPVMIRRCHDFEGKNQDLEGRNQGGDPTLIIMGIVIVGRILLIVIALGNSEILGLRENELVPCLIFVLLFLLPIEIGLLCAKGKNGRNKYGPNPLDFDPS